MIIAVKHTILDQDKFFGEEAQKFLSSVPNDVKLHNSYALSGGKEVICIWEAASIDKVRDLMDPATKDISKNEYFEVDQQRSLNLPQLRKAA